MPDGKLLFTEEEWNAAAPEVARRMHEYVALFCAAISQHRGDHGEPWGTGSFLRLGGCTFILTNEHVASARSEAQDLVYQLGNNDDLHFVRGKHASLEWPFDVALLPVDEAVWSGSDHSSAAITPDMIAIAHDPVPTELLMFAGYRKPPE
jgi:hypothetical protein